MRKIGLHEWLRTEIRDKYSKSFVMKLLNSIHHKLEQTTTVFTRILQSFIIVSFQ